MTQVVANQISLEYEARGDQQQPTVILMRGLGTQLIDWPEVLLDGLVEQGFHAVGMVRNESQKENIIKLGAGSRKSRSAILPLMGYKNL